MTEAKECSKCSAKLRRNNTTGVCSRCRFPWQYKNGSKPASDSDDGMLDRLGWGALAKKPRATESPADEAPPATKKPRAKPAPKPVIDWSAQLVVLAGALGLDGKQIIADFCRGWVEHTRHKALSPELKQLPAGGGEIAA
jgi:hypothetical protein